MAKHITITESDEPVELLDCDGFIALNDAVKDLWEAWRAKAETDYGRADWAVAHWLENALYDLWGPVGELAREEGRLTS